MKKAQAMIYLNFSVDEIYFGMGYEDNGIKYREYRALIL
jgi:hypothetical protein